MNAVLANPLFVPSKEREEICDGCGEPFKFGSQLWRCRDCRSVRVWGNTRPESAAKKFVPALNCLQCRCVTRHTFAGNAGLDAA